MTDDRWTNIWEAFTGDPMDPNNNTEAGLRRVVELLDGTPSPHTHTPFMYGIMCPDGTAYLDEICVDSNDSQTLAEVIEEQELEGHKVVPLYLHPPSPKANADADHIARVRGSLKMLEAKLGETHARIISDAEKLIYDLTPPPQTREVGINEK